MSYPRVPSRLSQISTMWTVLAKAHAGAADDAAAARQLLIERYGAPVRRYLRAAVSDADAADDLAQEFALALVRGEFRGADPERGRFRNYVKSVLFHLVARYRRSARRRPAPLVDSTEILAPSTDEGARFDRTWRDEILDRAWRTLEQSHPQGYALLRRKAEEPRFSTEDLANEISRRQGKPVTAAAVRQQLHRARERFAHYVLDAVVHSLALPTAEEIEDELRELDLLTYCREALVRYLG